MKPRSIASTLIFVGLVIAAVFAMNFLASKFRARIDLTQDRAFTLSEGTRRMLSKIDAPIQLRLYVSTGDNSMPPFLKIHVQRIEDLLEEMRQASGGKLEIQKLEPIPDSDAEDSAKLDGLEPYRLPDGSGLYLGLSASQLDQKVVLPFLTLDRERLLEYDIARAISRVSKTEQTKVGLMSPLRVMGPTATGAQAAKPWVLVEELRRDFDVEELPMNSPVIPENIRVLVLIHPKSITPEGQFAIDQFLLRGGRLVAFLDPYCLFDVDRGIGIPSSSTLDRLLPAWGLHLPKDKVLADLEFEGRLRDGRAPSLLDLTASAMNRNDVLTSGLDSILMAFAGTFTLTPKEGLTTEILLHSSQNSELVSPDISRTAPDEVLKNFKPSKTKMPLGLRLTGTFPTAFPEGHPSNPEGKSALKESSTPSSVILFSDADMIFDQLSVTEVRGLYPGGKMFVPTNGNLVLAQGAVEQLAGDDDLIAVRSRSVLNRPFTVVRAMQAEAEQKFQSTIRDLEASLQDTQSRLATLQQGKEENQRFLLTAEQQKEIANFRAKEADVKKQLKETRRQLRSEIDALENRIKWLNLAAIPSLVALVAVAFAWYRRRRVAAK